MEDTAEYWRAFRAYKKEKKATNRERALEQLDKFNVPYEQKNRGVHLIIHHVDEKIDYYPTTGLWIVRKSKQKKRGIQSLLRYLGLI